MYLLKARWYVVLALVLILLFAIIVGTRRHFPKIISHGSPSINDFKLNHSIVFLHDMKLLLPVSYLEKTQWMYQLKDYLHNHEAKTVIMVTANHLFEDILFNWLAAAQYRAGISPNNVLILSLDETIHQTLLEHEIKSVFIPTNKVIRPSARLHTSLSHLWIIRCMITRLLNNWSYDVMMFDLDAIIIKDPRPLFDGFSKADIIGSQGKYPFQLSRKWGVTLCMGVVLFRSTPSTADFWSKSKALTMKTQDDQVRINYLLSKASITWYATQNCNDIHHCNITGVTKDGLNITLLSQDIICRSCNQSIYSHYIWHGLSSKTSSSKERKAKKEKVWYLKDNWKELIHTPNVLASSGSDFIKRLIKPHEDFTR